MTDYQHDDRTNDQHRAKVFKSGNSLALRLPKALGLTEGVEMRVREEHGRFTFEPVDAPKRKFNVAKVAGSASSLRPLAPEDRVFEESSLPWPSATEAQGG